MIGKLYLLLAAGFWATGLQAQDCAGYFPVTPGAIMETTVYSEKGKIESVNTVTIQKMEKKDNGVLLSILSEVVDSKHKPLVNAEYEAGCKEGSFYISMKSMVTAEQRKAWKDMDVKMDADDIVYPLDAAPGQKLKDAHLRVEVAMNDFKMPGLTVDLVDREVVGRETLITPAGTFDCIKVKSTVKFKSIIGFESNSVEWLSKGNGMIRSESYKGDKLKGYTVLTKLSK